MKLKDKFKRQVEIVGLSLDKFYTKADFEDFYDCGTATIERDLKELRSLGIDIHSTKKKGVAIERDIPHTTLCDLVTSYLALSHSAELYDKATALLVQTKKAEAVTLVVKIQQAIERSQMLCIDYQKDINVIEYNREIAPLYIFQKENSWRLLARHEEKNKQYILGKILSVSNTKKKFNKPSKDEINKIFRYSFQSWLGSEEYKIKLRLSKTWGEALQLKPIMEQQRLIQQSDGSYILEGIVSSLTEFASWIASRGRGITVISPKPLKERVIEIATGTLQNYK